jgi:hypothetical protein
MTRRFVGAGVAITVLAGGIALGQQSETTRKDGDKPIQGATHQTMPLATFTAVDSVRIVLPKDAGPVLKSITALFARQVRQRCSAQVDADRDAALTIELAIEPRIGAEGFRLTRCDRPLISHTWCGTWKRTAPNAVLRLSGKSVDLQRVP